MPIKLKELSLYIKFYIISPVKPNTLLGGERSLRIVKLAAAYAKYFCSLLPLTSVGAAAVIIPIIPDS